MRRAARVAALAVLMALAGPASGAAETAFRTCDAGSVEAPVLTLCLDGLAAETAEALERVEAQASSYFAGLDAITGNQRGSRALAQARAAFALFRELDCHLVELDQGIGHAAATYGRACRIDHDRARIASLAALIGNGDGAPGTAEPEDAVTSPLAGSRWRVVAIEGEPVDAAIETTLEIDGDAAIAGSSGCNRYFGRAEIDTDRLHFAEIGTTRMACPDPIMAQESRYLAALERAATFALVDDALELNDQEGAVLVRLERQNG